MTVRAKCPVHEYELQPDTCAGCSIALIAADMLNGVPPTDVTPRKSFVDDRGLRPDGTGVIIYNQRLDDDLDDA